MNYGLSKSAEIVLSKLIFYVKNRWKLFAKKKSFKNINLEAIFCKKNIFSNSNFWTTLFFKIMSNFLRTVIHKWILKNLLCTLVAWITVWSWISMVVGQFIQNNKCVVRNKHVVWFSYNVFKDPKQKFCPKTKDYYLKC